MTEHENDAGAIHGRGVVLTGNALVPLGIVVSVFLAFGGAIWYIADELHAIQTSIAELRVEQKELGARISRAATSRFSQIDAQVWAERLKSMNPEIRVPEPIHYPLPGEEKP